jgi:hypothetical protein
MPGDTYKHAIINTCGSGSDALFASHTRDTCFAELDAFWEVGNPGYTHVHFYHIKPHWAGCSTWGCIKYLYGLLLRGVNDLSALSSHHNTLVWNVPEHDPSDYMIFRAEDDSENFIQIGSTLADDTVFVDTTITTEHAYHYRVTSIDGDTLVDSGVSSTGMKAISEIIFENEGWCDAILVDKDYVYLGLGSVGVSLKKIDISDPYNPVVVASRNMPGASVSMCNMALQSSRGYLLCLDCEGLYIVDISDDNLTIVGELHELDGSGQCNTNEMCNDISIRGDMAYIASGVNNGIVAVNFSNPASPEIWGTYNRGEEVYRAVECIGDYLYTRGYVDLGPRFSLVLKPIVNEEWEECHFMFITNNFNLGMHLEPIKEGRPKGYYAIGTLDDTTHAVLSLNAS